MTSNVGDGPIEILLVEDNPLDVRLTQEILEDAEFHCNLTVANDGEEAMMILQKSGEYSRLPRPDLILLDLNLPKIGGKEILAQIKDTDGLKEIPVIVLTASKSEEDILYSYLNSACSYIIKPVEVDDFNKKVRDMLNYWTNLVLIPDHY